MSDLTGAAACISDARSKVSLAIECLQQAMDEAWSITDDKAILATVKDGVTSNILEALSQLEEV